MLSVCNRPGSSLAALVLSLALFTQSRRRGNLRTSRVRSSPKFTKKNVINTAIERCARSVRRVGCNRCVAKRALPEGVGQRPAFPLDLG